MNTSSSASKKVFPITSQVYENGKAAKANESKASGKKPSMSVATRLKLRTLEMAENWVLEILQGEPKNSSGQQQPPLKIVEKLELMEDFIDQLPPYHWMQAKEWTKRLLSLWRLFGRSVYVQVAQGGPLAAAAAKEGGGDNSRGGVAQKKNGPQMEATSSSSYADRRAAALHSSPVAKLRKLHFLEETIIKILRCNNNNSIQLSSVEEYLRKSEEVVRQLPLTLRPEEWTKRVAQLRAEYHAKDVAEKEKRGELPPLEQQLTSIRVFLEGVFPDELLVFDLLPDITTVGRIKQWVAELLTGGEDDETDETEEKEDIVAPKTPKTTTTTKKHLLGYEGKVLDEKATVAACGIKDQAVLDFLEFEEENEEEKKEKDIIEGKKEEDNKKEIEKEELLLLGSDGFQFGVNVQPMKKLSWSETGSTFKMAKS